MTGAMADDDPRAARSGTPTGARRPLATLDTDDRQWRAFVETIPAATPFHHPAWARVLEESYGFRSFALALTEADGSIVAGMPVAVVGRPGRRRWVSLPFTDACRPLLSEGADDAFGQALQEVRIRERLSSIECRGELRPAVGAHPWTAGVRHALPIHDDLDRLRAGIGKMHRRNMKSAEKAGVEVRLGPARSDLGGFRRLHVLTRRRLGVPTQPGRFFDRLARALDDDGLGFVATARLHGETVAAAVFLAWNGTLVYKFGASDHQAWRSRPNNLLFWHAIEWASRNGCHTLDFGRTEPENDGLRQFKMGWGATEEPLTYTTLGPTAPAPPSGRALRLAGVVIRRAPPWVGQAAGRVLYRYTA